VKIRASVSDDCTHVTSGLGGSSGYFRMIRDFARDGKLQGSYGDADVTAPSPQKQN
jgi:hypothetical protein